MMTIRKLVKAAPLLCLFYACAQQTKPSNEHQRRNSDSKAEVVEGLSLFYDGYARVEKVNTTSVYINEQGEEVDLTMVQNTIDSNIFDISHGEQDSSNELTQHTYPGDALGYIDIESFQGKDSILLTTRHGISMWGKIGKKYEAPGMRGDTLTSFKYGFTRIDGTPLFAIEYDYSHEYELSLTDGTGYPDYFQTFITDKYLRLVKQDESGVLKMGLADHQGNIIVSPAYDMLYIFVFGGNDYILHRDGGRLYGYDYIANLSQQMDREEPRFGVINAKGQTIIPPVMKHIAQPNTYSGDRFTYLSFPMLGYDMDEDYWLYYTLDGKKLPYRGALQIGFRH